jgi:hypothetical protein
MVFSLGEATLTLDTALMAWRRWQGVPEKNQSPCLFSRKAADCPVILLGEELLAALIRLYIPF